MIILPPPLVSVLVLAYNHQQFVADCLNSILAIDYPNLEVVIVDDGSSDQTCEIIRRIICETDTKVRLIEQENSGGDVSGNCQKLLNEAEGEYILTISGDDLFLGRFPLSDFVETLALNEKLALVIPRQIPFSMDASRAADSIYTPQFLEVLAAGSSQGMLENHLYRRVSRVFLQGALIRKDVLIACGGFDTASKADDYAVIFRLFQYMATLHIGFLFIESALWLYRLHNQNVHLETTRQRDLILQVAARYIPRDYWVDFEWDHFPASGEEVLEFRNLIYDELDRTEGCRLFGAIVCFAFVNLVRGARFEEAESVLRSLEDLRHEERALLFDLLIRTKISQKKERIWYLAGLAAKGEKQDSPLWNTIVVRTTSGGRLSTLVRLDGLLEHWRVYNVIQWTLRLLR